MLGRIISKRQGRFINFLFLPSIVCFGIYIWKCAGCLGLPHCYLCQTLTPEIFLKEFQVHSSTPDFPKLMDLNNFTFLMNNFLCNKTDPLLLVLIHSDPYNVMKRWTIRNTWGQILSDNFKILFLMGIPNSTVIQKQIKEENDAFKDLVQGNFLDSYRNLTYKHVMALKWTKYFCPGAKYLLKTDDDVFINSPGLLNYVKFDAPKSKLMRCVPVYNGWVVRSHRSKWRVKFSEYKYRTYPPYCQGLGILYTPDVVATLYEKAQSAKYFWIDDVFITGILGLTVNITPTTFEPVVLESSKQIDDCSGEFPYLLGPWNVDVEIIRTLWEKILET